MAYQAIVVLHEFPFQYIVSGTTDIFTVRYSSCGKVMFSQACVKNSVQGGGVYPSMHWADTPFPPPTATAADLRILLECVLVI